MTGNDITLMTLGGLLLLGLATDAFARYTPLPRVTLLVLFGVAVGPTGLDLLPVEIDHWYALSADIALLMIGFLLGSKLSLKNLRKTGSQVLWISSLEVIGVAAIMFAGLVALGFDATISLLLAGIAPASAPAAIANVVDEVPHRGRFTELLLEVVAVDDAWGLIAFSIFLACAQAMAGGDMLSALSYGGWELGGALLVGAAIGLPAALLTGRVAPGQPTLMEALGVVLFCGGLALYLEVSFLLSAMIAGTIIANFAHHHERPFHEISNIQWPFMVLFLSSPEPHFISRHFLASALSGQHIYFCGSSGLRAEPGSVPGYRDANRPIAGGLALRSHRRLAWLLAWRLSQPADSPNSEIRSCLSSSAPQSSSSLRDRFLPGLRSFARTRRNPLEHGNRKAGEQMTDIKHVIRLMDLAGHDIL